MRRWIWLGLGALVVLCGVAFGLWRDDQSKAPFDPEFFEPSISRFEEADRREPPEPGGIVFVGSSSIGLWGDLVEQMAPLPVTRRGFGGSHMLHVLHNVHRVVTPYAPSAVVVYAGDNDLAGASGKTAEGVAAEYASFVEEVHSRLPAARIYFISIKPSVLRWDRWPEMDRANRIIEARSREDPRLGYFNVATPMLGAKGEPREELFVLDGLHLNDEGYRVWTELIRPRLEADLGEPNRE